MTASSLDGRAEAPPTARADLLVRLAPVAGATTQALSLTVAERVREAVSLSPRVEIAEARDLFDPEKSAKPTRLIDLR